MKTKLSNTVRDVTSSVIKAFEYYFSNINGSKTFVYLAKDIDYFQVPNSPETEEPQLPSVVVSFPKLQRAEGCYIKQGNTVFYNPDSPNALIEKSSSYKDIVYQIKIIDNHPIRLLDMMTAFERMFPNFSNVLEVYDPLNDVYTKHDFECIDPPDGTSTDFNTDSLYSSNASVIVHGVEFNSGVYIPDPIITEREFFYERIGDIYPNSTFNSTLSNSFVTVPDIPNVVFSIVPYINSYSLTLSWSPVPNAYYYIIYEHCLEVARISVTSYIFNGLVGDHVFNIRACNHNGCSIPVTVNVTQPDISPVLWYEYQDTNDSTSNNLDFIQVLEYPVLWYEYQDTNDSTSNNLDFIDIVDVPLNSLLLWYEYQDTNDSTSNNLDFVEV
jgi:hypothetical protein